MFMMNPKQLYESVGCSVKCDREEFSSIVYSRNVKKTGRSGSGVRVSLL